MMTADGSYREQEAGVILVGSKGEEISYALRLNMKPLLLD